MARSSAGVFAPTPKQATRSSVKNLVSTSITASGLSSAAASTGWAIETRSAPSAIALAASRPERIRPKR